MPATLLAGNQIELVAEKQIEISVRGKWITVPAMEVEGRAVVVRGQLVKLAAIHEEKWLETDVEDPGPYVKALREHRLHGYRADIFTFSQKPPATVPKFNYPMEWESLAAIRLTTFNEWWEKLPQETRKNVRRSKKRGIAVTVDSFSDHLVAGIVGVNNDSPLRQRRSFDHYGKTFDQVKRDQSSFLDRSDFVCAYLADELIGFVKLVYRGNVASILQLLTKASHSDKRPANALIAKVIELCEAKRISYLVYGQLNYGNKRSSALREFKLRNGFEEVLVPRFYVPLTKWGNLSVKTRLHRGLIGMLPQSLITAGIRVRAIFYSLVNSQSRCSSMAEQPNRTRQTGCSNPPAGSNFLSNEPK